MSFRKECHTEQYFSCDSAMARSTASAGTSPVMVKCSVIRVKYFGSSPRRSPDEVSLEVLQRVPALGEDLDEINTHAGGKASRQGLHRCGDRVPWAVENELCSLGAAGKSHSALPAQIDDNRGWTRGCHGLAPVHLAPAVVDVGGDEVLR